MHLKQLLPAITTELGPRYGEYAQPYAERILEYLLGCTRSELYYDDKRVVDATILVQCRSIVKRCTTGEPLDYIIGVSYFYNREFVVTPDVLIPRPDTETLIETVLKNESDDEAFFADVGTGSGIIACILTEQRLHWRAVAIDTSMCALNVVQRNRRSERLFPLCGDALSMIVPDQFDFLVSNPPYIPTATIAGLDLSVRDFEPYAALDGGEDGLRFYRYLADHASLLLKSGGGLYCEIGFDQRSSIESLFSDHPWSNLEFIQDIAGHNRVFRVYKDE